MSESLVDLSTTSRQTPPRSPSWVVVHLDGLGAQVATEATPFPSRSKLPPSALLPRWDGEPVRADVELPPHVRGSGHSWPPEASVSAENGSGRFPIAYAWRALETGKPWAWNSEQGRRTLGAAEAIVAATGAVAASGLEGARARPTVVLVVPNTLTEASQEAILDRARLLGLNLKLLWRPVAAALAWLERHESVVLRESKDRLVESSSKADLVLGRLVTVHMGVEGCEAASISLVARRYAGAWHLLPGRRRPRRDLRAGGESPESAPTAGRKQVERFAAALFARTGAPTETGGIWNIQWASSALTEAFDQLVTSPDDPLVPLWTAACTAGHGGARPGLPSALTLADTGSTGNRDLASVIQAARAAAPGDKILGIVITGCMGATFVARERLGLRVCEAADVRSPRTLVEGVPGADCLVALGATRFARVMGANRVPAYLDTLPQLKIVAARDGEPTWQPLLAADDRWVEGGRPWRRDPPFSGLIVRNGQEQLEINLNHEEYATVRTLTVKLPTPAPRTLDLSLDITMEPAQGRARIEVVPHIVGAFGQRRLWVEWAVMTDTHQTPDEYLDKYPRLFPPLHPRVASYDKWRQVRERLAECLQQLPEGGRPFRATNLSRLDVLAQKLRDRQPNFFDHKTRSRDASGIDCNGVPASGGDDDQIEDLVRRLLARLPHVNPREKEGKLVIRTLGYTSTPNPAFQTYLERRMRGAGIQLVAEEVRACGWCLRRPKAIAALAELVLDRLRLKDANTDWVKALSEMLRFRHDATKDLASSTGERLCEELIRTFDGQVDAGSGQYIFRTSCLSIVYLLRRRAYDDDFLDPEGRLALRIKRSFARAAAEARAARLHLVGGAIDLGAELQRLIDYIDRRGQGLPGIGVVDD